MRLLCNQVRKHRSHESLALHEWPPNQPLQQTAAAILVSRGLLSHSAAAAAELYRYVA